MEVQESSTQAEFLSTEAGASCCKNTAITGRLGCGCRAYVEVTVPDEKKAGEAGRQGRRRGEQRVREAGGMGWKMGKGGMGEGGTRGRKGWARGREGVEGEVVTYGRGRGGRYLQDRVEGDRDGLEGSSVCPSWLDASHRLLLDSGINTEGARESTDGEPDGEYKECQFEGSKYRTHCDVIQS